MMMNSEISDSEDDGDEDMMIDDDKNEDDDYDDSDDSQFSSWPGTQISKTSPLTHLTAPHLATISTVL